MPKPMRYFENCMGKCG